MKEDNQSIENLNLEDYIVRRYTKQLEEYPEKTVYDLFKWKTINVFLKDYKSGKVLYDEKDLEFPEQYSQNACDIIASKYFKRANVPNDRGKEYSMKQVVHRMVRFWMDAAVDEGLLNEKNKQIFYDEVTYMILAQMIAPNSPQFFNTGLKYYNTGETSDGHYYYDIKDKKVKKSKDKYSRTQASACFILSIKDKLLGDKSISDQFVTETRLFKHGSGTGTNYSNIRAKGEHLSGGGTSSGVISFMKGLDRNAGTIKSGGTTRRAARMIQLNVDHPEILEYIKWKAEQEQIVRDLGKMGYDISFDGIAYDTVSGQNGNNTIRFNDEFMRKVNKYIHTGEDSEFEVVGRVDKSVNKKYKVSEIWNEFCKCSWECADPAAAFDQTYNDWHTCPAGEDGILNAVHNRINSTNPCGEYAFLDDTACNLASINIKRFYNDKTNTFDIDGYKHCIFFGQLILEATIHWGQFPVEEVARKTHMFRTTGLGIANTAAVHLLMGHPYDSDEARNVAAALMSILTGYSYFTSSLMAKKLGAFEKYEINKPYMLKVIKNHARVSGARHDDYERLHYKPIKLNHTMLYKVGLNNLSKEVREIWNNTITAGELFGFRNAQVSVIAPTGTIAFAMDCEVTSIEPFFAHSIYKKLAGGGSMNIVNPLIPLVLKKLGYSLKDIKVINDKILKGEIENCNLIKKNHLAIFDTANKCGAGRRYISPIGHVKMMAALTPMVSGAISKTVNLPHEATVKDISKINLKAWQWGVKGIAIYRDGSKASQPLNTIENNNVNLKFEDMQYKDLVKLAYDLKAKNVNPIRNKPEGIRKGNIHPAEIDGVDLYVTISYNKDGCLSEIYVSADKEGGTIGGLLDTLSKQMSKMLQYNVPIEDIIKSMKGQKYEPCGFVTKHPYIKYADSISDLIAKILEIEMGNYDSCQVKPNILNKTKIAERINVKNQTIKQQKEISGDKVFGKTCPNCSSSRMVKNGTCFVCLDCGSTTGCS